MRKSWSFSCVSHPPGWHYLKWRHVRTADHPLEVNWIEFGLVWKGGEVKPWSKGRQRNEPAMQGAFRERGTMAPWQWKSMHKMCTQNICRAFNHFPLILTSGPHNSWQKNAQGVDMSVQAYTCRAHACGHSTSKAVDTVVDTTSLHSQSTLKHMPVDTVLTKLWTQLWTLLACIRRAHLSTLLLRRMFLGREHLRGTLALCHWLLS